MSISVFHLSGMFLQNFKKGGYMKKRQLRDDLEMMANYAEALEIELAETQEKLNNANMAIKAQMDHIEMLNQQLDVQDKAIERKDRQFEGIKAAYKDDLINGNLG